MRRVAREAVIFMLAGLALVPIGFFAWEHHEEFVSLQVRRDVEKKRSAECIAKARDSEADAAADAEALSGVTAPAHAKSMPEAELLAAETKALKSAPPHPTLPAGFLITTPTQCIDLSAGFVPESNSGLAFAPIIWLYGFIGGFGVWLFYRLVYFAVKG
jgi:hypothetical protein